MKKKRIGAETLPKIRPKYIMDTWRGQRVRRGFSDYDVLNVDYYLLCIIPGMLRVLARDCVGYCEIIWSYDERKEVQCTFEEYKKELLHVADEFDKYKDAHYETYTRLENSEEIRLHLFEWLGHNLPTLWD